MPSRRLAPTDPAVLALPCGPGQRIAAHPFRNEA